MRIYQELDTSRTRNPIFSRTKLERKSGLSRDRVNKKSTSYTILIKTDGSYQVIRSDGKEQKSS
jgi:hypothetical protein